MKVRLYTKVTVREVRSKSNVPGAKSQFLDHISGQIVALVPLPPEEQIEELLGEFPAEEQGRWLIVDTPRKAVRVDKDTLMKETNVNVFRVEVTG